MTQYTIQHRTGDYYGDGSENYIWEMLDEGSVIADLYVAQSTHEIMNITVRDAYQRQGLATTLYNAATDTMEIFHAPVAHRSIEGNAFAEAVGGPTIPAYPCDCHGCLNADDEDEDY